MFDKFFSVHFSIILTKVAKKDTYLEMILRFIGQIESLNAMVFLRWNLYDGVNQMCGSLFGDHMATTLTSFF